MGFDDFTSGNKESNDQSQLDSFSSKKHIEARDGDSTDRQNEESARIQKTAQFEGDKESDRQVQQFEEKHSDIFGIETSDDDEKNSDKVGRVNFDHLHLELKQRLDKHDASPELKENQRKLFRKLYHKYQERLQIKDITREIKITDQLLSQLIPDNPELQNAVKQAIEGNEFLTGEELLAVCIFQELIYRTSHDIKHDVRRVHEPSEKEAEIDQDEHIRAIRKEQHAILCEIRVRNPKDFVDTNEFPPITIEDLRKLNEILSNQKNQSERKTIADRFVQGISSTIGKSEDEYRVELAGIMQRMRGLDTLKQTFNILQQEGKLDEAFNESGQLNEVLFFQYYAKANDTVSPNYELFESVAITETDKTSNIKNDQKSFEERNLTLEEAKKDPVISKLISTNSILADHFLTDECVIKIESNPSMEGKQYSLSMDRNNPIHGLRLSFNDSSNEAQIYIGNWQAIETSLDNPDSLRRDLNSASSNHLLFDELNFPSDCFIEEKVDKLDSDSRNDPYQFVKTLLGPIDFPDNSVLNVTSALIKTVKYVISISLEIDFDDMVGKDEMRSIMKAYDWLDSNGRVKPEINTQLSELYQKVKSETPY